MAEQTRTPEREGVAPGDLLAGGFSTKLLPPAEQLELGVGEKADSLVKVRPERATAKEEKGGDSQGETRADSKSSASSTGSVIAPRDAERFTLRSNAPAELAERLRVMEPVRPTQWHRRLLRLKADEKTLHRAALEEQMRAMLPRPVTMVVAQPKGGGGKTPTTIGVSSALGDARGGGVIALDNHESRGTLADRIETTHDRNVGDLLQHIGWFLEDPAANSLALDWLCHGQLAGFKALAADQHLKANPDGISAAQFQQLHHILARHNPLIVVDTGNNETAPNWRAAVSVADVLIVPIRMRTDYLMPAARMLDGLRAQGFPLEERVVIVISNGNLTVTPDATAIATEYFSDFPQIEIPFDPVIDSKAPIRWDRMHESTRAAYRELGAKAVAMAVANASTTRTGNPNNPKES